MFLLEDLIHLHHAAEIEFIPVIPVAEKAEVEIGFVVELIQVFSIGSSDAPYQIIEVLPDITSCIRKAIMVIAVIQHYITVVVDLRAESCFFREVISKNR